MTIRSSFLLPSIITFGVAVALAACSSNTIVHVSGNGTDDGGTTDTEGGTPGGDVDSGPILGGDHGPYPTVVANMPQVKSEGGSVLKAPHIIPVFFPGDALQAQLTTFLQKLSTSQFLTANVSEYGVGAGDVGTPVVLGANPPASMTAQSVASYVTSNIVPKATTDSNTLFVVFFPASTSIDLGQGEKTCGTVGGYHESTTSGKNVAYAIVPRCQSFVGQQPNLNTLLEVTTASATHEIIEAMTDPYPNSSPAYGTLDADHAILQYVLGGAETGDMCAQNPHSFGMNSEVGFAVQRSWSNKAATSGKDPCVPQAAGEVYFNAIFNPSDPVQLQQGTTKALALTVGQARTIEVTLVTDAPMNEFKVTAFALNQGEMNFSFDKTGGYNGDKLKVKVTLNSMPQQGFTGFFLISEYNKQQQLWPVAVVAQ
jgi:hypothetical protein